MESRPVAVSLGTDMPLEAARVWALIRDFDAMPSWNASVLQSRIENGPADRVGCRRVLVFEDGGIWTHELTGLSDDDRMLQYRIVATPQPMRIPVWNYRAAIRVLARAGAVHDGPAAGCRVQWDAWFETAHPDAMQLRARQVFEQGFAGLRRHFGC